MKPSARAALPADAALEPAGDAASPRIRRIQRTALTLLLMSGVVNYLDRATLSIATPLIRHDLGFSVPQMGLLLSAFLWAYAFAQLPAGILIDRLGARLTLAASLGLWSIAQTFGGLVNGFSTFFAARMVLGVGEAPQFPTSARIVRDWFAGHERGTATGIWNSSSTLGTAISAPLLTLLMLNVGWRWMFVVMGAAGLLLAVAFYLLHRDPRHVTLTHRERAYLDDAGGLTGTRPSWADWRHLLRYRSTWGMLLGFFGTIYVLWLYNAWLPTYLQMEHHLTIARTGWVAAVPYVFGVIGSLSGGRICDVLARHGVSTMNSRKYPMVASLLGIAVFTTLTALTDSTTLAVVFISVSMLLMYISSSAAWAMASVAAPANSTASIGAMQNFGGYFGGALAPVVTGFIVAATHSFKPALYVGAAVVVVAMVGYWTLVGEPVPPRETQAPR
ncbi:MFS transporter [Burkholderia glumae]|uniref:MFS transporter n=1 Tax=Burkholderia glumae TaxID=337 RepID=A0AAP9XYE6_BURGL|nr:MFS transporter [Burkholderia glumae]ACR31788.1 Major facilitator superfamily [Burkholderia glumae BGR1]AJY63979.1 major Facilitator Superfamily protein [Burkholderia glumae LMG 2196 = ATCC 33617]MCM2485034.1 MFS transporter [Burkholderia glumae]MCM2510727.1 MFS transporter [Burkholderia glumae]PNL05937.1 MFS transporter [Burkholderia glumae]